MSKVSSHSKTQESSSPQVLALLQRQTDEVMIKEEDEVTIVREPTYEMLLCTPVKNDPTYEENAFCADC